VDAQEPTTTLKREAPDIKEFVGSDADLIEQIFVDLDFSALDA